MVALDARQRRFLSKLPSTCTSSKAEELYDYPTPGAPGGRVAAIEHARGRRAETMCWPDPGENPAVKTTILEDDTAAESATEQWAIKSKAKLELACECGGRTDLERTMEEYERQRCA